MKIICAGLSKTGTTSLARALRIHGYNVYDWQEHLKYHGQEWMATIGQGKKPDFVTMYKDVDAVTDNPPAPFFEEILEVFPDAKVILTERDNEDVWLESFVHHLEISKTFLFSFLLLCAKLGLSPTYAFVNQFIETTDISVYGSGEPNVPYMYGKKYRVHNRYVKSVVPPEQLLVFNVKEGWAPLCQFLGCDVPDEPFPRAKLHIEKRSRGTCS